MAMAIHSAKIFSELFLKTFQNKRINREKLEQDYNDLWKNTFYKRLKTGRFIQNILLNPLSAKVGFVAAKTVPSLMPMLIRKTHGARMV
jgi:flavin-dependent dehydrogenase